MGQKPLCAHVRISPLCLNVQITVFLCHVTSDMKLVVPARLYNYTTVPSGPRYQIVSVGYGGPGRLGTFIMQYIGSWLYRFCMTFPCMCDIRFHVSLCMDKRVTYILKCPSVRPGVYVTYILKCPSVRPGVYVTYILSSSL